MNLARALQVTIIGVLTMSGEGLAQKISGVGGQGAQQAVSAKGGNQYLIGGTTMFFNSKATQGGAELPGGTTTYSQANLQYNIGSHLCGFGVIYQQDRIGPQQTNHGLAVKAEFTWQGYYFEAGYGTARQTFDNRGVTSRSGSQYLFASGIRVPFAVDFLYFDGGVRRRTTTYDKQDGVEMDASLSETLVMPYVGMGLSL